MSLTYIHTESFRDPRGHSRLYWKLDHPRAEWLFTVTCVDGIPSCITNVGRDRPGPLTCGDFDPLLTQTSSPEYNRTPQTNPMWFTGTSPMKMTRYKTHFSNSIFKDCKHSLHVICTSVGFVLFRSSLFQPHLLHFSEYFIYIDIKTYIF
jgi:hypothetical protein